MTKKEMIEFLKEEYERIEDVLYKLGELKELNTNLEDYHIQDRFRDAAMLLRAGKTEELKSLLERASRQKWL